MRRALRITYIQEKDQKYVRCCAYFLGNFLKYAQTKLLTENFTVLSAAFSMGTVPMCILKVFF